LDMMLMSPLSSVCEDWRKTIMASKPIKTRLVQTPKAGLQQDSESGSHFFIGTVKEGDTFTEFPRD
jgi:hypothetical protein